jgi:hypothetical protein
MGTQHADFFAETHIRGDGELDGLQNRTLPPCERDKGGRAPDERKSHGFQNHGRETDVLSVGEVASNFIFEQSQQRWAAQGLKNRFTLFG